MAGTSPSRLQLAGLGAVLIVAPLVVWQGVSDMALLPPYLAWAASLLVLLLTMATDGPNSRLEAGRLGIPPFLWLLVVFVGWAGLSCLWARNPWEGVFEWSKLVMLLIWVWLLMQFRERTDLFLAFVQRCVALMAAVAVTFGYVQLVQVGLENGGLGHLATYQVTSFFAHRNLFAEVLLLALPLVACLAWRDHGLWRWMGGILAFLMVMMLVVLQVRSTWLGLGCQGLVGLLGLGLGMRKSSQRRQLLVKAMMLAGLVVAAGGIGFLAYRSLPGASNLLLVGKSITATHYGSTRERLVLWEKTLGLISDQPVTGYGLGSWRVELPRMGYAGMRMDMQVGKAMFVRAHNDYLQLAAETGVIGGLLYAGMLLMAIGRSIRNGFRARDDDAGLMAVLAAMGLGAYAVVAFFSFPMERVSSLILLGLYLGMAAMSNGSRQGGTTPAQRRWRKVGLNGGIAAVVACGLLGMARVSSDRHLLKALVYRSQGNWKAMETELDKGDFGLCSLDPTAAPMKWYAGSAKFQSGDMAGALQDFQAAYRANPHHLHVLNNLGAAWVQHGRLDSGVVYFQKAIALSPVFSEARVNLAATYVNQGKIELATEELLRLPDSLADPLIPLVAQGIVKAHVTQLSSRIAEQDLLRKLVAISNSAKWSLDILHKAAHKKRSLDLQLVSEAIYALEIQDKVINLQEAAELRMKYDSIL